MELKSSLSESFGSFLKGSGVKAGFLDLLNLIPPPTYLQLLCQLLQIHMMLSATIASPRGNVSSSPELKIALYGEGMSLRFWVFPSTTEFPCL